MYQSFQSSLWKKYFLHVSLSRVEKAKTVLEKYLTQFTYLNQSSKVSHKGSKIDISIISKSFWSQNIKLWYILSWGKSSTHYQCHPPPTLGKSPKYGKIFFEWYEWNIFCAAYCHEIFACHPPIGVECGIFWEV